MRIAMMIADERDGHKEYDLPRPYFGPDVTARLEGFASIKSPEIHVVSCVKDRRLAQPRQLADAIFYHPVLVKRGFWKSLGTEHVRNVRRVLDIIQPDLVHGFGTEYYMALCAAFSGFINCITILGNMRSIARKKKYRPFPYVPMSAIFEWVELKKTNAVFCNSRYTQNLVGGLCKTKWLSYPPVRTCFFDIHRTPSAHPLLLCIGLVVPHKNQIRLIEALGVVGRREKIQLLFVGGLGPDTSYNHEFLSAVEACSWCEYIGEQKTDAVRRLLSRATGLVHPTKEDSFANVVAEAMAANVPVAVSEDAGIADVIKHQSNGLLFDPDDVESIRSAVRHLLDVTVSGEMAAEGRRTAEELFAPEKIARQHIECYQQLIKPT